MGFLYHPVYLRRDTGQHVETFSRLELIISELEQTGLKDVADDLEKMGKLPKKSAEEQSKTT